MRRPRILSLAIAAIVLAVIVVVLATGDRPVAEPSPAEPRVPVARAPGDRSADARPADPRDPEHARSSRRSRTPPRPPPPSGKQPLSVRVVDVRGHPRARVTVELRDRDPALGDSALLAPPAVTDELGSATLVWPAAETVREAVVIPGLLLEEPLAPAVSRAQAEATVVVTPDAGAVEVTVLLEDGSSYAGRVEIGLLVATNDPPRDPLQRARATAEVAEGHARFPLVETGTLVAVEGRPRDPAWEIAPRVLEGPAAEGATVRVSLVARPRPTTRPTELEVMRPEVGPSPPDVVERPGEGSARVQISTIDALPKWPLMVQVGLVRPSAARGSAFDYEARIDMRGRASIPAAPGTYRIELRLWRATSIGWLMVGVASPPDGLAPATIAADRASAVELELDRDAVSAAAAALMRG